MPEISIIVPVYKVEEYLPRCIDSILAQTFTDFELILVDDGSPDNCGKICDEYAKKDERIIVIHKENGGQSSARNAGLDIAKGNYIGFVDSDDFISPDMYRILFDLIIKENADISEIQMERTSNNTISKDLIRTNLYTVNCGLDLLPKLYQAGTGNCVLAVWNKIYKSEIFSNIRFEEGTIFEDTLIVPFLYHKAQKVIISQNVCYFYYQGGTSTTRSHFSLKKLQIIYVCDLLRKFYIENDLTETKLWLDTTYAFYIINNLKKLKSNNSLDPNNRVYRKIYNEYKKLFPDFLKNPHFLWKQKILLVLNLIILYK